MTPGHRKVAYIVLALTVLLGSCTFRAPKDFTESLNHYHEGKAAVYVYRQPGSFRSFSSMATTAILLDGTPVCSLVSSQWTFFYLDRGQHVIETKILGTQPPIYTEVRKEVTTTIQIDASVSEYYIRIKPVIVGVDYLVGGGYPIGFTLFPSMKAEIELVDPAVGKNEIVGRFVPPGESSWNLWKK